MTDPGDKERQEKAGRYLPTILGSRYAIPAATAIKMYMGLLKRDQ